VDLATTRGASATFRRLFVTFHRDPNGNQQSQKGGDCDVIDTAMVKCKVTVGQKVAKPDELSNIGQVLCNESPDALKTS